MGFIIISTIIGLFAGLILKIENAPVDKWYEEEHEKYLKYKKNYYKRREEELKRYKENIKKIREQQKQENVDIEEKEPNDKG